MATGDRVGDIRLVSWCAVLAERQVALSCDRGQKIPEEVPSLVVEGEARFFLDGTVLAIAGVQVD
jgi:hypothetical protein